ncbi:MAG: coproporphyrinogen-III oxidase family protein [Planctomycetota bacterium]|jgi:oxygen-independent coproporphyrinogen-3 oxidase
MAGEPDTHREPNTHREETTAGNYFVANYPPFSAWRKDRVHLVHEQLDVDPDRDVSFGLYVHIPFCRKRCDFCYFRVYTDNDAARVRRYLDAVITELGIYASRPAFAGRKPQFVYFGGGTPSYLSADQLQYLFAGLREHIPWDAAQEITFECEPGTLQEKKIHALRDLGVTRLSLGVENFDPDILALNNRAHRAKEINKAWGCAREAGFPQINIDLIAGMVGETEDNWRDCIEKTRAMAPESVTIYQLEVPYNTTLFQRMQDGGEKIAPVADWQTKRRWVDQAFLALEADGYQVGSAYTAKKNSDVQFLYRDGLWHGADMLGVGVASFSHLDGTHFQNAHDLDPYFEAVERGELPIHRAHRMTADEQLIRQFILQLKLGEIETGYFQEKFGVDVRERFAKPLQKHARDGFLAVCGERITLSRDGLLQIDRLLHDFFLAEHRGTRYA